MGNAIDVDAVDYSEMASELSSKLNVPVPGEVLQDVIRKRFLGRNDSDVPRVVNGGGGSASVANSLLTMEGDTGNSTDPHQTAKRQEDLQKAIRSGAMGLSPKSSGAKAGEESIKEAIAMLEKGELPADDSTPIIGNIKVTVPLLEYYSDCTLHGYCLLRF